VTVEAENVVGTGPYAGTQSMPFFNGGKAAVDQADAERLQAEARTAPIRCAERRLRSSRRQRETCVPCRYFWAIPTSRTQCAIGVDIDDALTLSERTEI
jgi:hypothetical protein